MAEEERSWGYFWASVRAFSAGVAVSFFAAALLIALVVGALFATCSIWNATAPSAKDLRQKVERDVPNGATSEELQAWLDTTGREEGLGDNRYFTRRIKRASDYSSLVDLQLPPDTPVYQTIKRGTSRGLLVYFILYDDLRFDQVIVENYEELP